MQIETIGQYQLHLIAHELPGSAGWDAYVEIFRFDEKQQDFVCAAEKQPAADHLFSSYAAAIEAARRKGNALIQSTKS